MSNQEALNEKTREGSATLKDVLGWIFCFLFAVAGFSFMSADIIIGVCYLASAVVLIPPLKKVFKGRSKVILLVILLGIIGIRVLWSVGYMFFPVHNG
jgi:hypothetical protein